MSPPAKKPKFQNKKKFYQPNRKQYLEVGHKGFIATCNFNEKDCVRECYNLLNQFSNELYGAEEDAKVESKTVELEGTKVEDTAEDIADDLQKQIESSQEKAKFSAKRRFQVVDTGATNCVFIKTTLPDPISLAEHIVKDIAETKKQRTRYLLRLVPIEVVCKANTKDIVESAGQLCDKYFLNEPTTFSIVFNKRFNNDISRDALIRELADIIHEKNARHKVDLKYAKKSLIVEVIKGLCCLSVVDDYMAMKKYNLIELARANQEYDKKESKKEACDKESVEALNKSLDDKEQTANKSTAEGNNDEIVVLNEETKDQISVVDNENKN